MKLLIILLGVFFFFGPADQPHKHLFKSGKCKLYYSYISKNDSTFLTGRIVERKRKETPIINMNILISKFKIGTVPNPEGEFQLYLPEKEGVILFDKVGDTRFEFPYAVEKN